MTAGAEYLFKLKKCLITHFHTSITVRMIEPLVMLNRCSLRCSLDLQHVCIEDKWDVPLGEGPWEQSGAGRGPWP